MSSEEFREGVLIVDGDDEFLAEAKRFFEGRVPVTDSLSEARAQLEAREVDILFLGPTFSTEAGVAQASSMLDVDPEVAVVLVADHDISNETLRAAIRAGLADVIEAPLTREGVEDVLAQTGARRRAQPVPEPVAMPQGKVITVMAAKGGSGKTVTATNIATLLGRWGDNSRVAIVDGDLQFGDVALVLQVEPKQTIVNAAKEGDYLDPDFLDSVLARTASGIRVLAAPLEPAFADEVPQEVLTRIIGMLKTMFDYVVIDTAPTLDERLLGILERSDEVLFVVDMDLPSVKNAKLALETLRILNFPAQKIKIILNRSNSKARLDVAEIERSLRVQISASIPSDGLVPASVNEGVPIVESHPKSKPARAFEDVTRLVMEGRPKSERKRRWR